MVRVAWFLLRNSLWCVLLGSNCVIRCGACYLVLAVYFAVVRATWFLLRNLLWCVLLGSCCVICCGACCLVLAA